jgi:molecular chaperone GrpE
MANIQMMGEASNTQSMENTEVATPQDVGSEVAAATGVMDNAAATNSLESELDKLRAELELIKGESAKNKDGWMRSVAEFSNYKKRQETEAANLRTYATSTLIGKLLPVLDDFDRASKTLPESMRGMTWIDGLLLIHRKLQLVLESERVQVIEVKQSDLFDPNQHEAVSHDESDGVESGHVIETLQKGYKLGDRVIRPTLVRVAK